MSQNEISYLLQKLKALLPCSSGTRSHRRAEGQELKTLEEICSRLKQLHQDVDNLSEKVSQLLDSVDFNSFDVKTIKSLLQLEVLPKPGA